jgi:hypothetical protein
MIEMQTDDNYKWKFCMDRECFNCGKVIKDKDVEDQKEITSCPFCNTSFVE